MIKILITDSDINETFPNIYIYLVTRSIFGVRIREDFRYIDFQIKGIFGRCHLE